MMKLPFRKRSDLVAKCVFAALVCGVIPFLFVHGAWGELLQKVYLLTAFLLFVLLWANWESIAEPWFGKAMTAIVLVHSLIVVGLAKMNLEFPDMDRLPRIVYGVLSIILTGEVLGSMRFIDACRPKNSRDK
jgi:hypothetical protein